MSPEVTIPAMMETFENLRENLTKRATLEWMEGDVHVLKG
jgi:hypothetical protein